MSNSWFKFKQFTIFQDKTAMKVGTDGVLLGAWTKIDKTYRNILDIGTGTGLIALMMAQRTNDKVQIDAIELEEQAALQAKYNFEISSWKNRLQVIHQSIQDFSLNSTLKYDLIISNPPFFAHSYPSKDNQRQMARHTDRLSSDELLLSVQNLLKLTGNFSLIIPADKRDCFIAKARTKDLFLMRETSVYPTNKSEKPKRVLLTFTKQEQVVELNTLVIEPNQRHIYSQDYQNLTKAFYLKF